jgi:hypothetical protein
MHKNKKHLCPAHYFSHEIAESGKVLSSKEKWIGSCLVGTQVKQPNNIGQRAFIVLVSI